ncbi:MAG: hypothetical protein JXB32_08660, partial [Deltaproteobacteria bacterium]|nr:hypothetical protein [Deltaproteobacteria bacterium]
MRVLPSNVPRRSAPVLLAGAVLFCGCPGGDTVSGPAVEHLPVPQHPFLAPNGRSNMHDDAYMTDTYETPGPSGVAPVVELHRYADVLNTCATLAFDAEGRILTTSAVLLQFSMLLLDPDTLEPLASYPLPPRDPSDPLFPYDDTSGAAYFVVDERDRLLLTDGENAIQILAVSAAGDSFVRDERHDLAAHVVAMTPPARDHVQMTIPDWSGRYLWWTTRYGVVGTVERVGGAVATVVLDGEEIENSFAVGEDGVYVVTDHALYRFHADAAGVPTTDWRAAYD